MAFFHISVFVLRRSCLISLKRKGKLAAHISTLTSERYRSSTGRAELWLQVFIQCDVVPPSCKARAKKRQKNTPPLLPSFPNNVCKTKQFESKRCLFRREEMDEAHSCIAVFTGRGFGSPSSVFISDGCTPFRPTPYATYRRRCVINQTL